MNDQELERFEAELRRAKPAAPPADWMARLSKMVPQARAATRHSPTSRAPNVWANWFRWLVPATALAVSALVIWGSDLFPKRNQPSRPPVAGQEVKADDVQIDQELVSSFDAVAKMPDGEPVRFRCRKWMDNVVVSDRHSGLVLQQRTPRFEVVPVGYDTY